MQGGMQPQIQSGIPIQIHPQLVQVQPQTTITKA